MWNLKLARCYVPFSSALGSSRPKLHLLRRILSCAARSRDRSMDDGRHSRIFSPAACRRDRSMDEGDPFLWSLHPEHHSSIAFISSGDAAPAPWIEASTLPHLAPDPPTQRHPAELTSNGKQIRWNWGVSCTATDKESCGSWICPNKFIEPRST
jgi:hypothetical protein